MNMATPRDSELVQQALDLINEYCDYEYGDHTDYTVNNDLSDLSILFTTDGDEEAHILEIYVDLLNPSIKYYYDGTLTHTDSYSSLEDFIANALVDLSWDWLYSAGLDYAEEYGFEL